MKINIEQEIYARKREALQIINRSLMYIFLWYLPFLGLSIYNLFYFNPYHLKFMFVFSLILISIWIALIVYRSVKIYKAKQYLKELNSPVMLG
jgi:hypothetical protein